MINMKYKLLFYFLLPLFILGIDGHGSHSKKVLLISLDGFRHDYFKLAQQRGLNLKNFNNIFLRGTKADHINNLFITRTFPNHMSIITGCYEESHGIIDNTFFDPDFNESFKISNVENQLQSKWFSAVEPLWVTNQLNGHKSAIIHWPGQLAPFRDKYWPSYSFGVYNKDMSLNYKIDVMMGWMKEKDTTLGIMYHPHPDIEGHKYGPNSSEVSRVVSGIDDSFGYLLTKIQEAGLEETVNVVVVSDHGMSEVSFHKIVPMDKYLNTTLYHVGREESMSMWGLWPRPTVNVSEIIAALRTVPHVKHYIKKDIPQQWRYSNNRRVAPIIVIADEGWVLKHSENDTFQDKGVHGFTVASYNMMGIFFAWGPDIVASRRTKVQVREIDVFPLVAEILKFNYRPQINGSLSRLQWILRENEDDANVLPSFIMVCSLALLCALAVCIMISCAHYHAKSIHCQRVGQTYALQTGKLVRIHHPNIRKDRGWVKLNKNKKKVPKVAAADTAFLLESSSGADDEILGDIGPNIHKFSS